MRKSRISLLSMLVLTASGAATVAAASPASAEGVSAAAVNCYSRVAGSREARGYCTSGTYRVYAQCEENSGNTYTAAGSLAWGGVDSTATCHEGAWVVDRWMVKV